MERHGMMGRIDRGLDFVIRHHTWVLPFAWLALVALPVLGAWAWGGFDPEALPWITGVLAVIVAGVTGGVIAILKGRRVGWGGILGWLLLPLFHFGSLAVTDTEGWAPTFFADVIAILLALALAGGAVAASLFEARAGSRWERVLAEPSAGSPSVRQQRPQLR